MSETIELIENENSIIDAKPKRKKKTVETPEIHTAEENLETQENQQLTKEITFSDLGLNADILKAITYNIPTPIQLESIPPLLARRDMLGCAQTGSGKTAAFSLPILHHLANRDLPSERKSVRSLILAPTRELATQIYDSCKKYGKYLPEMRYSIVVGGVRQHPQVRSIAGGVDILVGTPGRVMDLIRQGHLTLKFTEILVLDEADHMMDIGFIDAIRTIVKMIPSSRRQTLLFSATMPPQIARLAEEILTDPVIIRSAISETAGKIAQSLYYVKEGEKMDLLLELMKKQGTQRAIVFTGTKQKADDVVDQLEDASIAAESIHSDKSQPVRQRVLENFRRERFQVLVATDIAARGIDIEGITLVINYDLPRDGENYKHRIGRTGRAGNDGMSASFAAPYRDDRLVSSIEAVLDEPIPVNTDHPFHPENYDPKANRGRSSSPRFGGGGRSSSRSFSPRGGRSSSSSPRTGSFGPRRSDESGSSFPREERRSSYDPSAPRPSYRNDRSEDSRSSYDPSAPRPSYRNAGGDEDRSSYSPRRSTNFRSDSTQGFSESGSFDRKKSFSGEKFNPNSERGSFSSTKKPFRSENRDNFSGPKPFKSSAPRKPSFSKQKEDHYSN